MKELTHKEIAQRGGRSTLKKHGKKHFKRISKKGGEATARMWEEKRKELIK